MNTPASPEYVSTTQVAESLGVSVSTVKRWVEDDILPAQKTAGGHRKLLLADVIELARRNNLPLSSPAFHKRSAKRPKAIAAGVLVQSLHRSLLAGQAQDVRRVLQDAYRNAMPIETLADDVIAPAMQRIGNDWESGRIDVLHEHRATQLCLDVLHDLKTNLESRARRERPLALGGAVEGDYSELPTLLAQMVLLEAGWEAVNLGPNTPLISFGRALTELRPRLVWISFSHGVNHNQFIVAYRDFYQRAEKLHIPVMIGGRALTESLRAQLPYTAYGDSLATLGAFARTLYRPRGVPKRGRPKREGAG